FLIYSIIYLGARFIFVSEGNRLTTVRFVGLFLLHTFASGLVFGFQAQSVWVLACLLCIDLALYLIEGWTRKSNSMARGLTMIVGLGLIFGFTQNASIPREFTETNNEALAFVFATLLCLKESNFVIRCFFRSFHLANANEGEPGDSRTKNGRIIGGLERTLLLFFLWDDLAVAATLIIAIKGLARFKKMEEDQAFAEYVIIGTFLSIIVTLLIYKIGRFLAA
ncbi:MAG: hypothetical protein AAF212_04995, partial [Verrucomicrobiota bacterium]